MSTIRDYRLAANLTEQDLADKAGVSRSYISKLQNYVYLDPSLNVIRVLAEGNYTTPAEIIDSYRAQYNKLQANRFTEPIPLTNMTDIWVLAETLFYSGHTHPHVTMRIEIANWYGLETSQVKWCEYTGLHPAVLNKYELFKTKTMPQSVRAALIDKVQVPKEIVNKLYELVANND